MSHCNVRLPRWCHWISFAAHAWKDKATEKPTTKSYCWELGTCTANSYVHHEPWNLGHWAGKTCIHKLATTFTKTQCIPWSLCTLALAKDSICPSNHRKVVLCFVGMLHPTSAHYLNSNLTWNPHKTKTEDLFMSRQFCGTGIARYNRLLWATLSGFSFLWYPMIIEGSSWVLPLFGSLKWWGNSRRVASDCHWIHQLASL